LEGAKVAKLTVDKKTSPRLVTPSTLQDPQTKLTTFRVGKEHTILWLGISIGFRGSGRGGGGLAELVYDATKLSPCGLPPKHEAIPAAKTTGVRCGRSNMLRARVRRRYWIIYQALLALTSRKRRRRLQLPLPSAAASASSPASPAGRRPGAGTGFEFWVFKIFEGRNFFWQPKVYIHDT